MSETLVKPWMRQSDTEQPIPTPAEIDQAYEAVRGIVEQRHVEAMPDEIHHLDREGLCVKSVGWETDAAEQMDYIIWTTADGVVEHEVRLTSPEGVHNRYVGSSILRLVTRTDGTAPGTEAGICAEIADIDRDLAVLLNNGPDGYISETACLPTSLGVTVGEPEAEHLVLYLSDDSVK